MDKLIKQITLQATNFLLLFIEDYGAISKAKER